MQSEVVLRKLDSLRRCLKRIEEKQPIAWDAIGSDYDLQDILSINLERAVQLAVDAGLQVLIASGRKPPDSMSEVFQLLGREGIITETLATNLRKAVGFRNISVHDYQSIDWKIVESIVTRYLKDFYRYIEVLTAL